MRAFVHGFVVLIVTALLVLVARPARAGSKEECLEAHGRGQVEREKGQLTRARHTFTTCAQPSCPAIVQADCARMSEELSHLIPTVTFAARDASAADLPAASVFVDEVLVATRLDDGKAYELDPGKHAVRYVYDTNEVTLRVVLNQGEKGRVLTATFPALPSPVAAGPTSAPAASPRTPVVMRVNVDPPAPKKSLFPLGIAGIGAAALTTGAVLFAVGLSDVPSRCRLATNECSTPRSDPALGQAKSAVSLANMGMGVGIAGAAALVGGVVWYLLEPAHSDPSRRGQLFSPMLVSF